VVDFSGLPGAKLPDRFEVMLDAMKLQDLVIQL
jgi:hypothetical protein